MLLNKQIPPEKTTKLYVDIKFFRPSVHLRCFATTVLIETNSIFTPLLVRQKLEESINISIHSFIRIILHFFELLLADIFLCFIFYSSFVLGLVIHIKLVGFRLSRTVGVWIIK